MIFLSLDEFQAERFLKVAAETISPPHHQTSPSAVTEGGDTPMRHLSVTTVHHCPPILTAEKLQQQLETPSDGQVAPQWYQPPVMGKPVSLLLYGTALCAQERMPSVTPTT